MAHHVVRWSVRPIDTWPGKRKPESVGYPTSGFRASHGDTVQLLEREIEALGADAAVLQVDLLEQEIALTGHLLRSSARPRSPGVIVSFAGRSGPLRFACDRFAHWHENLRAIALGLEALRKVDRYGISHGTEQYQGFRAIGAGEESRRQEPSAAMSVEYARGYVRMVAGVDDDVDIRTAYRRAVKILHPDAGGEAKKFHRLQEAMEVIERYA